MTSRRAWGDAESLLLRMLRGDTAWPAQVPMGAMIEAGNRHGVLPLLFHVARGASGWPTSLEPLKAALGDAARHHAAVELASRNELICALEAFAARGIESMVLKGAAHAYTLYPEPWTRPRGDADILVRPAERQAAFELLESLGYRSEDRAGGELASSEASFRKQGSPLVLDVHWRINNSPLLADVLEFGALEAHCVPVPALGPHALAPGAADAMLLAAMHRAKHHHSPFHAGGIAHRGDRLIWLYDLHLLTAALTLEQCGELADRASRHGVAGLCLDALRATQGAFGTPLPPALMDRLARDASRPEPSMVFLRGGRRRLLLAELWALHDWRERGRWLREHALPPADYMLRKYDTRRRWLLPALYVRRAFGWLTR